MLGFYIPEGVLHPSLGHVVASNSVQQLRYLGGAHEIFANDPRRNKVRNDVPSGVGGLGVVRRSLDGGHLSPPTDPVRDCFHQKNAAILSNPEAGFKGRFQLHSDFSQGDAFDLHNTSPGEELENELPLLETGQAPVKRKCTIW